MGRKPYKPRGLYGTVIDDLTLRLHGYGMDYNETRKSMIEFIVQLAKEADIVENAIGALGEESDRMRSEGHPNYK